MRNLLMFALILSVAGAAMAIDLGTQAPAKPADNSVYVAPEGAILQGGDTYFDAVVIDWNAIPGTWTGTTVGYTNNYDEMCPYTGNAPDVVYSVTPAADVQVNIDLCFSEYDTKLYVYDADLNLIGCNDDFHFGAPCFTYSSKLESLPLQAGVEYFIVVDGYGPAAGAYQMDIEEFAPCILECPVGAQLEGEPPLQDGYVDAYNSGCGGSQFGVPFQPITEPVFCGVSGWFVASGIETRDTDWFHIIIPEGGVLEITGDAEYATYMFELSPQDCGQVGVAQNLTMGACFENTMSIVGAPGSLVWFWVGPTTFTGPVNEYNYVLNLNIPGSVIATENHSWTGVKSLFN